MEKKQLEYLVLNRSVPMQWFEVCWVPKGGVIIGQGDTHQYLYVLEAGKVDQIVDTTELKLPGKWLKIASIKKGELFGTNSLGGTASECCFVAKSFSQLYRIHQEQFLVHFDRMEVQALALI